MLKIVYPICCGMDVHKSFVYACIASTNEQGVTTYKKQTLFYVHQRSAFCAEWLAENNCKDVCMESTGKYWIPVYNILEQTCNVVLAHPKYVKAIKGKKTDKKDAKWLRIFLSTILFQGALSLPQIFVSFGTWFAIAGSSPILLSAKEPRTKLSYSFQHQIG